MSTSFSALQGLFGVFPHAMQPCRVVKNVVQLVDVQLFSSGSGLTMVKSLPWCPLWEPFVQRAGFQQALFFLEFRNCGLEGWSETRSTSVAAGTAGLGELQPPEAAGRQGG